jgi:hypothetical protein
MEIKKSDLDTCAERSGEGELQQLADLELAVVGGGMGDVAF